MAENDEIAERIRHNWTSAVQQVSSAAIAAGRPPESIRVVGVSKYVDAPTTQCLLEAGCRDLGESRPQVMWQKAEQIAAPESTDRAGVDRFRWHMIGHVQTNKLRRLLRVNPLIHSVDSERLLRAIDTEATRQQRRVDVLLEVNISGDESKTGLSPDALHHLLEIDDLASVRILGLMAMAGWGTQSEEAARQFSAVASLRDQLASSTAHSLKELSMGMSADFREAIAAGATMVRIGSALFEGVVHSR